MSKHRKLIDQVKPGGPGLTDEEVIEVAKDRDEISAHNLRLIQGLNTQGVQVDAGLEAITQFRTFLQEIGVITPDQRLTAEVMWESSFNNQLRASMSQVRQMQAQTRLGVPPQGLILPSN